MRVLGRLVEPLLQHLYFVFKLLDYVWFLDQLFMELSFVFLSLRTVEFRLLFELQGLFKKTLPGTVSFRQNRHFGWQVDFQVVWPLNWGFSHFRISNSIEWPHSPTPSTVHCLWWTRVSVIPPTCWISAARPSTHWLPTDSCGGVAVSLSTGLSCWCEPFLIAAGSPWGVRGFRFSNPGL